MSEILTHKRCSKCGELRPISSYVWVKARNGRKARYASNCNICSVARAAVWQANNQERYNAGVRRRTREYSPEQRHAKHLRVKYGMTPDEYQAMYDSQGGRCAICGKEETVLSTSVTNKAPKKLSVDHDHQSGQVRGLLCSNCNAAIGYFQDDASLLGKAVEYLKRWLK